MKKILLFSKVTILALILMAGCSQGNAQPFSSATNPQTSNSATTLVSPSPTQQPIPNNIITVSQSNLSLTVTGPADGATINSKSVVVKGRTSPGATVNVNDEVDVADENGDFSITISLVEGPNAIVVDVFDGDGNEGEVILLVSSAA